LIARGGGKGDIPITRNANGGKGDIPKSAKPAGLRPSGGQGCPHQPRSSSRARRYQNTEACPLSETRRGAESSRI
jgi:hypothetical protein